jgi:DNA-binding GntR family transcriptional regulator
MIFQAKPVSECARKNKGKAMSDTQNTGGPTKPNLYETVFARLRSAIESGALPTGQRIKEGSLSSILGISRAPVRRALEMCLETGLIVAASGQGYVIGSDQPIKQLKKNELIEALSGPDKQNVEKGAAWETIVLQVQEQVTLVVPFGTYRVLEAELGETFNVSRTVSREVLMRLKDLKLVEKNRQSHWIAGPLTARDIHEAMEMRQILEPHALTTAAPLLNVDELQEMLDHVLRIGKTPCDATEADLEKMELDLHKWLYVPLRNRRLIAAIEQNQLPFVVPRLFRQKFGSAHDDQAIADHRLILEQLIAGNVDVAAAALETHLIKSRKKMLQRLRVLSVLPKPESPKYMINLH